MRRGWRTFNFGGQWNWKIKFHKLSSASPFFRSREVIKSSNPPHEHRLTWILSGTFNLFHFHSPAEDFSFAFRCLFGASAIFLLPLCKTKATRKISTKQQEKSTLECVRPMYSAIPLFSLHSRSPQLTKASPRKYPPLMLRLQFFYNYKLSYTQSGHTMDFFFFLCCSPLDCLV